MTDKEIVQYYGQQWLNVKHMKDYIKQLRKRYEKEVSDDN